MIILDETVLCFYYWSAADILDRLIELCGEDAIRQHVEARSWYSTIPDSDQGPVLVSLDGNPVVQVGEFDDFRQCWRVRGIGPVNVEKVVGWMPLPEAKSF